MTGLESIPIINGLFTQLIDRVKDRQTATLVGQVQSLFQSVQAAYFAAEHKALETATKNLQIARQIAALEDSQPKTIAALNQSNLAAIAALRHGHSEQIANLIAKHQTAEARLKQRIEELIQKPVIKQPIRAIKAKDLARRPTDEPIS